MNYLKGDKIMEKTQYKILLIEDDKLDQMAFKRMVQEQELSYDCTIAGSVSQAKEQLSASVFDVIISDYSLGDGTAFDILGLAKSTPVILVTGAGNEEVAAKAWRDGAYDYLLKDHDRNYLKTVTITVENAIKHRRLENRLQLLSHAIVSTDDSVYITNLENEITFVNRAFCETYGYTEEEIIGKDCNVLWKESPLMTEKENVHRAVSGWEVGFFHRKKDGGEFPVSLTRSDVKDENGNEVALVVIARDISERMEIENELRVANQQLKRQNRLRKELAVVACDQLKSPLANLKDTISGIMALPLGKAGPQLRDHLELAVKKIDRLESVVKEFSDIAEVDASKINMQLSEIGLRTVVSEILRALTGLAGEKGVELQAAVSEVEQSIAPQWQRIVEILTGLVGSTTEKIGADDPVVVQPDKAQTAK